MHATMVVSDRSAASQRGNPPRAFGVALFLLAALLVLNTLFGPLAFDVIDYPFSASVNSQLIGLECVTVLVVAPLSIVAGVLALIGHRAAGVLAFGPAAYTAYMFAQYVLGPEYGNYRLVVFYELGIFVLGLAIATWAWALVDRQFLPFMTRRKEHLFGAVLLALGGFVLSRYVGAITGSLRGEPIPAEFDVDRTFYWTIVLLDLGVIVPATIVGGVALIRGSRRGHTALYALLGWYSLVPPSVAAMSAVMVVDSDPNGSVGLVVVLVCVAILLAGFTVFVYWPLFGRRPIRNRPIKPNASVEYQSPGG